MFFVRKFGQKKVSLRTALKSRFLPFRRHRKPFLESILLPLWPRGVIPRGISNFTIINTSVTRTTPLRKAWPLSPPPPPYLQKFSAPWQRRLLPHTTWPSAALPCYPFPPTTPDWGRVEARNREQKGRHRKNRRHRRTHGRLACHHQVEVDTVLGSIVYQQLVITGFRRYRCTGSEKAKTEVCWHRYTPMTNGQTCFRGTADTRARLENILTGSCTQGSFDFDTFFASENRRHRLGINTRRWISQCSYQSGASGVRHYVLRTSELCCDRAS